MSENILFFNKIKEENNNYESIVDSKIVEQQIKFLFPNLNVPDKNILLDLSVYLINFIGKKFYFKSTSEYNNIWIQNSYRDIKSVILKLLPFIDDKDNFRLYKKIYDLNQILYYLNEKDLPKDILKITLEESIKNYFPISNFSLGLMNINSGEQSDYESLIKFYDDNNEKLIYKIIHHNFISLLETIKNTSNKLYVNWINVIPIHLNNLYNSDVYINTIEQYKQLENISDEKSYQQFDKDYNGLNIGDIYNIFRIGYFQNMKSIKWLIFNKIPKNQINDKKIGKYFIQLLDEFINIDDFNDCYRYMNISEELKIKFDKGIRNLVSSSNNRFELLELIKSINIFLVNNYHYKNLINLKIKKEYRLKPSQEDNTELQDLDYNRNLLDKVNSKTSKQLINDFLLIGNEHIFNFIFECINDFKSTIYSSFLYDEDGTFKKDYFYIILKDENNENVNTQINLKNLYNIAKTLSFFNLDNNWIINKEYYTSLQLRNRINFFRKITDNNIENWLNIRRNIREQLQNTDLNEGSIFENLKTGWNKFKIYFVFYYLVRKGLLTKFVPNKKGTDDSVLPTNYGSKMKAIRKEVENNIKNEDLGEAYYYLTDKKYKNLENYYEKDKDNIVYRSFLDRLEKDMNWYTFYAMDWMAQISFFHTYINHQILFVTGSTGTGKTSQVPKLILYALKCVDYKDNGKISCTAPRIPPTVGNARTVSEQLGVPIFSLNPDLQKEINTNNYYVQYKHQNDQHTSLSSGLQLKITTDGTLFEEITENCIMKEKLYDKNKDTFEFSLKNKYDVLIVDEAHEHGKNMDLILSLARNSCYYNNSLRLVIISATMEDDEPNYRSYYRFINDNLLYPIKQPLIHHPFLDMMNFLPQTLFMERRFHISKPGETTQFKIEEISRPVKNENMLLRPWDAIQENSYKVVNEIFSTNPSGNILLFLNGEKEIKKAVKSLNLIIPSDAVALPFFGKMSQKYKDIIERIDTKISSIKNNKYLIHEEWGEIYLKGETQNNFRRAVIIATNVAEASITIPNLKFVVDNGYSKQLEFFYDIGESILSEKKISNTSRIQRKGRVGRISDGTVYYLYDPNSRKDIKTRYNISFEDFTNEFIKLCIFKSTLPFYSGNLGRRNNDPYLNSDELQIFDIDDSDFNDTINNQQTLNSITRLINNNFYGEYSEEGEVAKFDYKQYFPEEYYNFAKSPIWISNQYLDGFSYNLLQDEAGEFFIIHPLEKKYKRNILRQFIFKIDDNDLIILKKNSISISDSFRNRLTINFRLAKVGETLKDNSVYGYEKIDVFRKTYLSKYIENFIKTFTNIEYSDALILMCSYASGLFDEVIMIMSLIEACNGNISRLIKVPKQSFSKTMYFSNKSDLEPLLKICENFRKAFSHKKIFNFEREKNNYKNEYENTKIIYLNSKSNSKSSLLSLYNKVNENDIKNLVNIDNQGKLNTEQGFQEYFNKSKSISSQFEENLSDIELQRYSETNYFDPIVIRNFVQKIISYKIKLSSLDFKEDSMYISNNPLLWIKNLENNFKINFANYSKIDKIINLFLIGYSQNVCLKKNITDKHYHRITNYGEIINDNNSEDIEMKLILNEKNELYERFLNHPSSLVFYIKLNIQNNIISIISNITEKNLFISNPFYYNENIIKKIIVFDDNSKFKKQIYTNDNQIFRSFLLNLKNSFSKSYIIWNNKEIIPHLSTAINYIKKID